MTLDLSARPRRPAQLLVVDDQELGGAGLRSMLASEPDLEVVGEATNGREAQTLCQQLHPDLVLMDMRMPGLDGLATTQLLKAEFPELRVVIVTMYENPDYLLQALKVGADGYVLKDATQRQLVTAVRQVLRGEFLLDAALATQLLRRMTSEPAPQESLLLERLTPREYDVLQLMARGQTNRAIAQQLEVSAGTVKIHVAHIIAKLGVADRTQAAVRAVELGLLGQRPE